MISSRDFSVALSALARAKGYTATIVLTLGVTLGAMVAMYSLNYQLLSAPLPYPDQDRLYVMQTDVYENGVKVSNDANKITPYESIVEAYRRDKGNFEEKAIVNFDRDIIRNLPTTPQVNTTYITPEYLGILGPRMELGRLFENEEGLNAHEPVVVISYDVWRNIFNKEKNVLGKSIQFGSTDFRIVGVLAEEFHEPQLMGMDWKTDVWLPWDFNRVAFRGWENFNTAMFFVGKIKDDRGQQKVELALTSLINPLFKQGTAAFPDFAPVSIRLRLESYKDRILGDNESRILLMLAGAIVLVLIASANITNLILSRAANRQRTMAIQAAIGAQKHHLFSGVFAEILILMLLSFIFSIVIGVVGVELLKSFASDLLPRISELHLTWKGIAYALCSSIFLALSFSYLVSRQVDYKSLNNMLQGSGKGGGIQISVKVRHFLIVSQVAFTGILLVGCLQILFESLQRLTQPIGLSTDNVHQIIINTGPKDGEKAAERRSNLIAIRDEFVAHSKVTNATLASYVPMGQTRRQGNILSPNENLENAQQGVLTNLDDRYFNIIGWELVAGRNFTNEDFQFDRKFVIVNETMANRLSTSNDIVGKRYYSALSAPGTNLYEVIGIVRDISLPGEVEVPRIFVANVNDNYARLILKMRDGQTFDKTELNNVMAIVNGEYKVSLSSSMEDARKKFLARETIAAWLTGALSVLALILAAIGTYGVLSYSVQLRRYELGIRMAIGATPTTVFLKVLRDYLVPVIVGIFISLGVLMCFWLAMQESVYLLTINPPIWISSIVIITVLTSITSLMSVWGIIRKPAIYALRNA